MEPDLKAIVTRVRQEGWCRIKRLGDADYRALVAGLGTAWCETVVELRADVRSHLCTPDRVPFHTDHPMADWMAWRCEAQDESDGAQQLIDGREALAACGSVVRERLTRVHVAVRVRQGAPPERTPLLRRTPGGERLFFAPWLEPLEHDAGSLYAFERLHSELEVRAKTAVLDVRLAEGEVLIIDNGRWLHGRAALAGTSRQKLRRFWISRDGQVGANIYGAPATLGTEVSRGSRSDAKWART